ncbi:MAG: hypothetical protein U1E52_18690 [Geminicoccaceae bacterium]
MMALLPAPEADPARRQRRLRRRAGDAAAPPLVIALIAGVGMAAAVLTAPWPLDLILRHLAAGASCPAARSVGLAPARHGEPGYWAWHDPDLDGWSCASLPGGVGHGFWVLRWW